MNRIHTEGKRVIQLRMVVSLALMVSMMLSGCVVSKKKYEAAMADMESAKIEFEKSRMMREAVEQENDKLRNEKNSQNSAGREVQMSARPLDNKSYDRYGNDKSLELEINPPQITPTLEPKNSRKIKKNTVFSTFPQFCLSGQKCQKDARFSGDFGKSGQNVTNKRWFLAKITDFWLKMAP